MRLKEREGKPYSPGDVVFKHLGQLGPKGKLVISVLGIGPIPRESAIAPRASNLGDSGAVEVQIRPPGSCHWQLPGGAVVSFVPFLWPPLPAFAAPESRPFI